MKRFLLITFGITSLYLGLDAVWLALTPALASLTDARTAAAWEREAASVREAAREADDRLPAATRVAAYRLGFHVGYCSNVLGSVALSTAAARAQVHEILAPGLEAIEVLARELGAGEVSLLPVTNVDEFGRVSTRLDEDELGPAASSIFRECHRDGVAGGVLRRQEPDQGRDIQPSLYNFVQPRIHGVNLLDCDAVAG